jgi:hypothetical protein
MVHGAERGPSQAAVSVLCIWILHRASRMGSQHGRKAAFPPPRDASSLAHRSLKSVGEVSALLEETINRVRAASLRSTASHDDIVLLRRLSLFKRCYVPKC